jgi:superfamily II DNA or RNA helicase
MKALMRHPRVMVFCPSVRCAEEAAEVLSRRGYRVWSIVAGTPAEQRQNAITAFRSDDKGNMAILNYSVLTAGFDAPRTRCVIVARPTTSLVLYSQMVGRAMRGPQSGGNRHCQVYTFMDTSLPGFGSVVEAFSNWEELWLNQDLTSN